MTKAQLLDELASKEFVDAVVTEPVLQTETAGSKWYRVSFREINGKAMINRSIDFYVIDEGTAKERAYYKDREPEAQIKTIEAV